LAVDTTRLLIYSHSSDANDISRVVATLMPARQLVASYWNQHRKLCGVNGVSWH